MSIRRALNVPATAVHTVRRAARSLLLFQTICNFSGNGAWKHGTGLSREKLRAPVNVRSGSTSPLTRIPRPAHQRGHAGYTKQPVLPSLPCKHEHATKKAEFLSCISNGQTIQDRDGVLQNMLPPKISASRRKRKLQLDDDLSTLHDVYVYCDKGKCSLQGSNSNEIHITVSSSVWLDAIWD